MELQYEKALEKYHIKESELPEDAITGIAEIKNVLRGMRLAEKNGNKITPAALGKLRAMDKWVYYEILDVLNDTNKNNDQLPHSAEEVIKTIEKEDESDDGSENQGSPELGIKVNAELATIHKNGLTKLDFDQLKAHCPITYDVIFNSYDDSGENGVVTPEFSLVEKEESVFILTKK